MKHRLNSWITRLQKYADRWWYAPLIGVLAFADLFIVVVPTDGLLISAVMLAPRRWIASALVISLGSSLGAIALAYVLSQHGLPVLLKIMPGIDQSSAWTWTSHAMSQWGLWTLFIVALSPMMQHPAIAIAALAGMSIPAIFPAVFGGRVIKYLLLAWLATHAPKYLSKLWGIGGEIHELGLDKPLQKKKK